MRPDLQEVQKIGNLIEASQRILIISHRSPDGDTVGSALALYHILKGQGKSPELYCIDGMPSEFNFLPNIREYKQTELTLDYDAYISVDVGATHLTGLHESHPELFNKSLPLINIDHHYSNDYFGQYNVVMPTVASATMVVYYMAEMLNYTIDRVAATALLTGIYTDTGSFMHSNTSAEVLRVAAKLLSKGADRHSISKEIFNTTKISTMHLWGRVLKNTHQTPDGVTMSVITKKDFEETGADYSEMTGAVDYVNSVPNSKYSVILTERDGKVKGSLRTLQDDVNVAEIASKYGGAATSKQRDSLFLVAWNKRCAGK
ncbi:bifunctional oligoribonuclease/PAP phosphatase NrnA [Candidatus Peregrinibacteria bacterium]|nr:MAG: bifunctional oligoribonuclease/PAP phosphatase NrnA [Candidatus Peregrinibacteria bacterium]